MNFEQVLIIAWQLLTAINSFQSKEVQIIHGNISTDNIMLQNELKSNTPIKNYNIKIIDFSTASWFTDPDLNYSAQVKYAPAMSYRPP